MEHIFILENVIIQRFILAQDVILWCLDPFPMPRDLSLECQHLEIVY